MSIGYLKQFGHRAEWRQQSLLVFVPARRGTSAPRPRPWGCSPRSPCVPEREKSSKMFGNLRRSPVREKKVWKLIELVLSLVCVWEWETGRVCRWESERVRRWENGRVSSGESERVRELEDERMGDGRVSSGESERVRELEDEIMGDWES